MDNIHHKAIKPIVLKTPLGLSYFDHNEIVMLKAEGNCTTIRKVFKGNQENVRNKNAINLKYIDTITMFFQICQNGT